MCCGFELVWLQDVLPSLTHTHMQHQLHTATDVKKWIPSIRCEVNYLLRVNLTNKLNKHLVINYSHNWQCWHSFLGQFKCLLICFNRWITQSYILSLLQNYYSKYLLRVITLIGKLRNLNKDSMNWKKNIRNLWPKFNNWIQATRMRYHGNRGDIAAREYTTVMRCHVTLVQVRLKVSQAKSCALHC